MQDDLREARGIFHGALGGLALLALAVWLAVVLSGCTSLIAAITAPKQPDTRTELGASTLVIGQASHRTKFGTSIEDYKCSGALMVCEAWGVVELQCRCVQ